MAARHLSVAVACSFDRANAFLGDPANMPLWAEGLGGDFAQVDGEVWAVSTPYGRMEVRFTPPNPYGVIDHALLPEDGPAMYNPLRVVPNGEGCEVTFTLFRRDGMTGAEVEADAAAVERDLRKLKALLKG